MTFLHQLKVDFREVKKELKMPFHNYLKVDSREMINELKWVYYHIKNMNFWRGKKEVKQDN